MQKSRLFKIVYHLLDKGQATAPELAVIHQKCVKITYASSYGQISKRIVQPLKMAYKSMSWY